MTNLSDCCKVEIYEDGIFRVCSKCNKECDYFEPINNTLENIPFDIQEILIELNQAYQGVGDLEGSGDNLGILIPKLRKLLDEYNIKW